MTQGLLVSSLPLPNTQGTDVTSKDASCIFLAAAQQFLSNVSARFKHICWNTIVENTPSLALDHKDAYARYNGSLGGMPLHMCSETSSGLRRPRIFWPSWAFKGSSDVTITPGRLWEHQVSSEPCCRTTVGGSGHNPSRWTSTL